MGSGPAQGAVGGPGWRGHPCAGGRAVQGTTAWMEWGVHMRSGRAAQTDVPKITKRHFNLSKQSRATKGYFCYSHLAPDSFYLSLTSTSSVPPVLRSNSSLFILTQLRAYSCFLFPHFSFHWLLIILSNTPKCHFLKELLSKFPNEIGLYCIISYSLWLLSTIAHIFLYNSIGF